MKTALFVDCCIRGDCSRTRKLAEAFLTSLPEEYERITVNLMEENLSYFAGDFFAQRERLLAEGALEHPRFRYASQFAAADLIVIAAPFWDLSFPALLKVYVENVSVDGITFSSTQDGLKGLCRAKQLVYLTTRGGFYDSGEMEMASPYMASLCRFFGIEGYHCVAADGMDVAGFDAAASLAQAERQARELAAAL